MEEMKMESQKIFEGLPKEERKLLRKEFGGSVGIRIKFFLWCGIGLLLPALIGAGFSIYYMLNIFIARVVEVQLYICAAVFTLCCGGSLLLTSQYHKRFRIWLRECKNIVTKADTINGH
jgi:hypothetical protein